MGFVSVIAARCGLDATRDTSAFVAKERDQVFSM
jgi:hypothetical protein